MKFLCLYDSLSDLGTLPDDSAFLRLRLENGADLDPMGDQPVVPDDDADPPAARYRSDGRLFAHFEPGLGGAASGFGVAYQDFSRFFVWPDGSFAISDGGSIIETLTLGEGEPNETSLVPDPEGIGMDVVAVFNADGTLRWAVKLENGDPWLTAQVVELGIDPDGSVIAVVYAAFGTDGAEALIGSSDGTVASATFVEYPNVDATAELLVKWDSEGVLEWVKQIPKIYEPSPLLVRNDGTIVLMDDYLDGVAFDPGGPGEAVIDHGDCDQQFCFFAVEIAPDASSFTPHLLEGGGDHIAMRQDGSFALADGCSVMAYSADYELEWTATIKPDSSGGVWIHDIATLAGGSLVVTGDYSYGATFGAGELNETTLHGVCDECQYGAFLARYAW